jgi:hypothetical protein
MAGIADFEYTDVHRIQYGDGATFIPICEKCRRFIKPPANIKFDHQGQPIGLYANCTNCGATTMPWEGYP